MDHCSRQGIGFMLFPSCFSYGALMHVSFSSAERREGHDAVHDPIDYLVLCGHWALIQLMYQNAPFVEITCPEIPVWDGKIVTTSGDLPGDFANCSCGANKTFPDGISSVEVTCLPNGKWSDEIPDCTGTPLPFIIYVFFYLLNPAVISLWWLMVEWMCFHWFIKTPLIQVNHKSSSLCQLKLKVRIWSAKQHWSSSPLLVWLSCWWTSQHSIMPLKPWNWISWAGSHHVILLLRTSITSGSSCETSALLSV